MTSSDPLAAPAGLTVIRPEPDVAAVGWRSETPLRRLTDTAIVVTLCSVVPASIIAYLGVPIAKATAGGLLFPWLSIGTLFSIAFIFTGGFMAQRLTLYPTELV